MSKHICMLAHLYDPKRVIFPAFIQPKLDGVRAIWKHKEKRFISRQNKPLAVPQHIIKFVCDSPFDLDGELLIRGLPLNKISGAVRLQDILNRRKDDLYYNIFDIITEDNTLFFKRYDMAHEFLIHNPAKSIVQLLMPNMVFCHDEIQSIHKQILELKFEGSIIRNNSPYEFKRSFNLLKLKPRQRIECEIIGLLEGTGKYENMLGALTVKTPQGKIFNVGTGFNDEERNYIWENPAESYNNIFVIVEFRDYSEFGIPIEASFKGFKE